MAGVGDLARHFELWRNASPHADVQLREWTHLTDDEKAAWLAQRLLGTTPPFVTAIQLLDEALRSSVYRQLNADLLADGAKGL